MKSMFTLTRFARFWRTVAFVALSAFIMVIGSEKMYWYIQGIGNGGDTAILVTFYMIPVLVGLWFVARGGTTLAGMVLAGAAFGWIVEGVITPELYSDGPIGPFFPGYFAGWHGLLSLVTLWYLFRRWAVAGDRRTLGRVAAGLGVFWGWWSMTYWLPETIKDPELIEMGFDVGVWPADKFAVYALAVGSGLTLAHWLIGYVWPERWVPTRRWTAISVGLILVVSIPVLASVPWGVLKLGALLGLVSWASRGRRPDEATVFPSLTGRPPFANVAPMLIMPLAAAVTYAIALAIRPSDAVVSVLSFWIPTTTIAFGGAVGVVWAVRRRRRETARFRQPGTEGHVEDGVEAATDKTP